MPHGADDPAVPDFAAATRSAGSMVHIVDDDDAVRSSLAMLLGSFGHASTMYRSAETFLADLDGLDAGCVIVDIQMPGMSGLALQQELARRDSHLPVVIVTGHGDVPLAVHAMKAGAVDFIEKPYSEQEVMRAVATALERLKGARAQEAAARSAAARLSLLSPREHDVLRRLLEGRPNKVIAHQLGISPRTVEIHRARIMDKLECRSLAEVVRIALTGGHAPDL
jgi:two-component system response regulator FixJ